MKIKIINKRKKSKAINRGFFNTSIFKPYHDKLKRKIYNQFKNKDL